MRVLFNVAGLLASLLLSFISSGMETALYRVSRVRTRIRAERGDARAGLLLRVLAGLDAMVTAILINNNIAAYAGTFFLTMQLVEWRVPQSALVTTIVITPLFFVLTESLPKQLAYNQSAAFSLELIRVFTFLKALFSPMVWILNRASLLLRGVLGAGGGTDLSLSQRTLLMEHLSAGVAEKVLTEEQKGMAERIMQLEGISAGDSMIPLPKLLRLPETTKYAKAVRELRHRPEHLAILIDTTGRPTGWVVTLTDILMRADDSGDGTLAEAGERLERIGATRAIPEVLNLFRKRHARMAFVTAGSRITGLITTKTVLDRIAGITCATSQG